MMKLSELEATRAGWCKEHRNVHKQVPGVCSFCLRDKLSQLYSTDSPIAHPLCYYSPSPISSPASPSQASSTVTNHHDDVPSVAHRKRFRRNASHAMGSGGSSCIMGFNNLKKSRSLAFSSRNRVRSERDAVRGRSKGDGFWSKVLKLKRRETEESVVNSRVAY